MVAYTPGTGFMMKIDRKAGGAPALTAESASSWRVQVSNSVLAVVPNDVLRPWLAVESFARDKAECFPSNKALLGPMAVGSIRVVQSLLERLEDHGVIIRRMMPGNRRSLVMVRRAAAELTAVEWAAMVAAADRRAEGRKAVATIRKAERKRHRPSIKIVG